MDKIRYFLKLIRWQNLLMIAIIMYAMRWLVVYSLVNKFTMVHYSHIQKINQVLTFYLDLQLTHFQFLLLVLSVVFLAAAGYVINDYFDRKMDLINRPDNVIVGKHINRRTAMTWHVIFNVLAVLLSLYVSWKIGHPKFALLFLLTTGILWFYSTSYKQTLLVGNLIVAFLAGCLPLLVPLYELPVIQKIYRPTLLNYDFNLNHIFAWVAGFAFFSFISTFLREIIKDMEDFEGDKAYGRNSLPVAIGIKYSKVVVLSLIAVIIFALLYINFVVFPNNVMIRYTEQTVNPLLLPDKITLLYFIILLIIPLLFLSYLIIKARSQKQYHLASTVTKIIMLLGLGYSFIVYYTLNNFQTIAG